MEQNIHDSEKERLPPSDGTGRINGSTHDINHQGLNNTKATSPVAFPYESYYDSQAKEDLYLSLKDLPNNISLESFIISVCPLTKDTGSLLKQVLLDELKTFNSFVRNVFDNHNQDISQLLAEEEKTVRDRYVQWTEMIENRSERVKKFLKELIPNFDIEEYKVNLNERSNEFFSKQGTKNGDFNEWRQEHFLKLLFLEDEARNLQTENDVLMKTLDELQKQKHINQTDNAKCTQLLKHKNALLEKRINELSEEQNQLSSIINDLLIKDEKNQQAH